MVKPRLRVPSFSRVLAASGRGGRVHEFTQPRFYLLAEYCIWGNINFMILSAIHKSAPFSQYKLYDCHAYSAVFNCINAVQVCETGRSMARWLYYVHLHNVFKIAFNVTK